MRPEDLLNRLVDQPFRPFRLQLTDGTAIDVPEPGMTIVGRSSAVLPTRFGRDDEGHRLAEYWRTIALLHILQISDLDERVNGGRRKRK